MLVEACEYRENFLQLAADHAVILGIEPDHFDCYDSFDELTGAFTRFARSVREDGLLLARAGCRATEEATRGVRCRVETFGFEATADWQARGLAHRRGRYRFELFRHGRRMAEVRLALPGRHNVLNALAAAALGWHEGMRAAGIGEALGRFRGLVRRMEVAGSWRGVTLVDDYAHHPTEVAAGLDCVREMYPGRRVWCVFQPHQASRTARLLDELAASLQNADRVVVSDVYRAREPYPLFGEVTAADLAHRVRSLGGRAAEVFGDGEIVGLLTRELRPGDVLITMGAGDIGKIGHGIIHGLREDRAAG
jgi:UDP-N-acetylmuramate--alanine ligase